MTVGREEKGGGGGLSRHSSGALRGAQLCEYCLFLYIMSYLHSLRFL